jgi:hypothetical protein
MKAILIAVQETLLTIPELRYVDEDWGQLDDYSPNPPTQFPLALIDVGNLQYSDISRDRNATPQMRQMASGTVTLRVCSLKLTNSSGRAPKNHKAEAWTIWDILEKIHEKLHGNVIGGSAGALMRTNLRKRRRDDGIQEFELTYTVGASNV